MARLTLTTPGEDVDVGGTVTVIGTRSSGEVITIIRGDISLDASFNAGGDTIVLPGDAGAYTVQLSGSRAIIASSAISVSIPLGSAGTSIQFAGETLSLLIDPATGEARLGQLALTSTAQVIPQRFFGTNVIVEVEANDTVGTANQIDRELLVINPFDDPNLTDPGAPSVELRGQIEDNDDVDVFAIHLEAGEMITLDVDGGYNPDASSSLDSVVSLLDSAGNVLAENDNGPILDVGTVSPFDPYLTFQASASGTYYIAIEGVENGTEDGDPTGTYHLLVSIAGADTAQQQALAVETMMASSQMMTFG